jgi:hypothetical protein
MKFLTIILLIFSIPCIAQDKDPNCDALDKCINLLVNKQAEELTKHMPLGLQSGVFNLATALTCEITQDKYTIANMEVVKNPSSALQVTFFTIKQNIITLAIYSPEDNVAADVIFEYGNGRLTINELNFSNPF